MCNWDWDSKCLAKLDVAREKGFGSPEGLCVGGGGWADSGPFYVSEFSAVVLTFDWE